MPQKSHLSKYYSDSINLNNTESLEAQFHSLLQRPITSLAEWETWLRDERKLLDEVKEAMTGHQIDFLRYTSNPDKRDIFLCDQQMVQPILANYQAKSNQKFMDCPFTEQLDSKKYNLMKKVRKTKLDLFREENISLMTHEQELITRYREIMGSLTISWDGETKTYSYVQAQIDHPDKTIREQAWHLLAQARYQVKPEIDKIMDELVSIRHQIAIHAGFKNYRDYIFALKNREYSIQDCYDFHKTVEKYVVPVAGRLSNVFQSQLGVNSYRPWDHGPCTLQGTPFTTDN